MLALYKQYLQSSDINIIEHYNNICSVLNKQPIIFTDKILSIIPNISFVPVFNTLYLTKIHTNKLIIITNNEYDKHILYNIGIHNNIIIANSLNINDTISQIRSIQSL